MAPPLGNSYTRRRRIAIIITLGMLTALGPFTIDLYLPSFPALKADLGITDAQVQLTLSATTLGFALGQLIVGPLSDRLGRRVPLIVSTALHVTASVLVAIAPTVEFLTAMRTLQGIGASGGAVVAMAMARDLFGGRQLVVMLSRLALVSGLAPIIAPIVGSWMVSFMPWRGVFWALAVYGALVIVLVTIMTVETRPPSERTTGGLGPLARAYRMVFTDRLSLAAIITAMFSFGALFSYVSSSSVLLQEVYGLSPSGFGAVFAICSFGVFLGVQLGSRLGQKWGSQWVLALSTSLMVLAGFAVLLVDLADVGYLPLVPSLWILTFGFGLTMPNAQILLLHNHRERSGTAASVFGAMMQVTGSVVGPIIGLAPMTSAVPMGTSIVICGALASAAVWLVLRPRTVPDLFA